MKQRSDKFGTHDARRENFNDRDDRERKPLEWRTLKTIAEGDVMCEITTADGDDDKKFYSVVFGKKIRDKTSKFFKPTDIADLEAAVAMAKSFLKESGVELGS